ncbi:MAG: hypothetical protein GY869_06390, partial [Planctomycetes bacterium]|nr:hypothetical protein [Planctomycetota bacterium]
DDGGGINVGFAPGDTNPINTVTIINCTITSNVGSNGGGSGIGGGLCNFDVANTISIGNTIIALNTLNNIGSSVDASGTVISLCNNLIGDGTGSTGWQACDLAGTQAVPIDPLLNSLADNGGPTQTISLQGLSQALDAGNNALVMNPPFDAPPYYDQRGVGYPRIVDNGVGAIVDIGAFEFSGSADDDGDGVTVADGDCDDTDPDNYPGNTEVCDGQDNDCNTLDDFGNPGVGGQEVDGDGDGSFACVDCNDGDINNFPGNTEICDGLDNDCNTLDDYGNPGVGGQEVDGDGDGS